MAKAKVNYISAPIAFRAIAKIVPNNTRSFTAANP
jgi:hypothetical protein